METLKQFDIAFSQAINGLNNPTADTFMILVSEKLTWIPLYLLLGVVLYRKLNTRTFLLSLVFIVLGITLADQISVVMKYGFERLRPCHDESINSLLHMPEGCGGQFSFVSSHAANTMCLTTLAIYFTRIKWLSALFVIYAAINSYSRVYLGKHFLGDVMAGMILGFVIGLILFQLFKWLKQHKYFSQ